MNLMEDTPHVCNLETVAHRVDLLQDFVDVDLPGVLPPEQHRSLRALWARHTRELCPAC